MRAYIVALMLACAACSGGEVPTPAAPEAILLTRAADLAPAVGKLVQVRGRVDRVKLGQQITADGFSIVCTGNAHDDDVIGTTITVSGVLARVDTGATVNDKGEISQGTEPGTETWMIRDCTRVR